MQKHIPVLLGTAREGNNSQKVAQFVVEQVKVDGRFTTAFISVSDFLFGNTGGGAEKVDQWKQIIEKADGLIVVSPEYNHSFPGELKILLDSLYDEYKGKAAAIVGVSAGSFAGTRMIEHLKIVLHTINFTLLKNTGNIGPVSAFDEDKEECAKQVQGLLDEFEEKLRK